MGWRGRYIDQELLILRGMTARILILSKAKA